MKTSDLKTDTFIALVMSLDRVQVPGSGSGDRSGYLVAGEVFRIVAIDSEIVVHHAATGVEYSVSRVEHVLPTAELLAAFVRDARRLTE